MMLCLACRRISPDGSRFCSHCARSLNGRLCAGNHWNSGLHGESCTVCGSPELSEPARALRLKWVSQVLAALLALGLWKTLILSNLLRITRFLLDVSLWVAAVLANSSPTCLWCSILGAVNALFLLWLLGHLLSLFPERGGVIGRYLRELPVVIVRFVFLRLLPRFARFLVTTTLRLVFSIDRHGKRNRQTDPLQAGTSDSK